MESLLLLLFLLLFSLDERIYSFSLYATNTNTTPKHVYHKVAFMFFFFLLVVLFFSISQNFTPSPLSVFFFFNFFSLVISFYFIYLFFCFNSFFINTHPHFTKKKINFLNLVFPRELTKKKERKQSQYKNIQKFQSEY